MRIQGWQGRPTRKTFAYVLRRSRARSTQWEANRQSGRGRSADIIHTPRPALPFPRRQRTGLRRRHATQPSSPPRQSPQPRAKSREPSPSRPPAHLRLFLPSLLLPHHRLCLHSHLHLHSHHPRACRRFGYPLPHLPSRCFGSSRPLCATAAWRSPVHISLHLLRPPTTTPPT